ncbi:MAG TPA: lysylphosphatidylglycerol synthase transmembrane domain-containing protein [Gaiellaceae bacterium]|nr:lysylphosphatidylglycerol synthase transmembrane domain-containing protein [Gaiellaceae bacterium]
MDRRRKLFIALQVTALVVFLGFLGFALQDSFREAGPRLRDADIGHLALAFGLLAVYYLLFVVGWLWILRALHINVSYRVALQSEMVSMLAKYVPGGVWTPAARVMALRRYGVTATPTVLSSIALEAGLSAIAGVLVFIVSLPTVDDSDAPLWPLVAFAVGLAVLLHPRVFRPLMRRLLKRFGASELPPIRQRTLVGLVAYYAVTWVFGGLTILYLIRAVGGDVGYDAVPYLGGVGAVGAIVAVLSFIAPSGLGVREASMFGLMLAVTTSGVALGATVLNRIAITLVEAGLLLLGAVAGAFKKP